MNGATNSGPAARRLPLAEAAVVTAISAPLDGEALALGVRGQPRLPGAERAGGVGLVGEGLTDRLGPVGRRLVEERRPLEGGVDRGADVGEDLVDLLAAVERRLLSD